MQHSKLRIALHNSNSMVFDMRPYKSMGEPVGDPNGGAAFGEKNSGGFFKAITAVVGIVATVMTAGAASPLMAGIMYAGAALSAVGLVTGNAQLGMIGGLMSMGAGLANSYQAGSGLFSGLEKTASGLSNAGEAVSTATSQAQGLLGGASSVSPTAGAIGSTVTNVVDDVGGIAANQSGNALSVSSAGTGGMRAGTALEEAAGAMSNTPVAGGGLNISDLSSVDGATSNAIGVGDIAKTVSSNTVAGTGVSGDASFIDGVKQATDSKVTDVLNMGADKVQGLMKSIESNPTTSKIVADFIKGAYQSPQDKALAQAQIDRYNQLTATAQQQNINAQAVPTMNMNINPNAPVQFNTSIRGGQGIGLLNRSTQLAR